MREPWVTAACCRGQQYSATSKVRHEVADTGHVRTIYRSGKIIELKPYRTPGGYLTVQAHGRTKPIHLLVMESFVGPRPAGMDTCHRDGNGTNNHLTNLRYGSRQSNMDDSVRLGRVPKGETHYCAKLRDVEALEIYLSPERGVDIAARMKVSPQLVTDIRKGRVWSWLTGKHSELAAA